MSFTREDVLRELELLPVWQLRVPLASLESQPAVKMVAEITPEAPAEVVQKTEVEFDYFQSENLAWIFICTHDSMLESRINAASQSMLFNNILVALQIKTKKYDGDLATSGAKVLIAMGEKPAQTLLNCSESIDNLRGKIHLLHNLPLIVTYSAAEMLEHLPNKAKTWHDLCTALRLVNA